MLQKYIAYRLPTLTITLFNLFPTKTSLYFLKAKMCYSVFIIANIPVKTKCLCVNLATLIPLLPKSRSHRATLLLCSTESVWMINFMSVILAEASVLSDSMAHLCVRKILHLGRSLFTSSASLALNTDVFGDRIIAKFIMRMNSADHNLTALCDLLLYAFGQQWTCTLC